MNFRGTNPQPYQRLSQIETRFRFPSSYQPGYGGKAAAVNKNPDPWFLYCSSRDLPERTSTLAESDIPDVYMSTSDFFGDPPAGIDLTESRTSTIYGAIIPVAVIATLVVALRIRLRTLNGKPSFKIDDFMVTVALVRASIHPFAGARAKRPQFFTWGTAACCFISEILGSARVTSGG